MEGLSCLVGKQCELKAADNGAEGGSKKCDEDRNFASTSHSTR
jgi:hypothetical protein